MVRVSRSLSVDGYRLLNCSQKCWKARKLPLAKPYTTQNATCPSLPSWRTFGRTSRPRRKILPKLRQQQPTQTPRRTLNQRRQQLIPHRHIHNRKPFNTKITQPQLVFVFHLALRYVDFTMVILLIRILGRVGRLIFVQEPANGGEIELLEAKIW